MCTCVNTNVHSYMYMYMYNAYIHVYIYICTFVMQKEHHAAVVKHYSESEGAYADLLDDGYVYQKLLGHISAAGIYNILSTILEVHCVCELSSGGLAANV